VSVQIKGATAFSAGGAAVVDNTFQSLRITQVPLGPATAITFGAQSGALTGVAASGPVFSIRNAANVPVVIKRVGIGFVTTTAFTAAQQMAWGLYFARSFTVDDSAGTAIAFTGNNAKKRTSLGVPTSVTARIAAAGANTAGTRTLDANPLSVVGGWSGAVGAAPVTPDINNLFNMQDAGYPIVLAQNEGLVVANVFAMGAAGVGTLYINVAFDEYAAGAYGS
jgi:hypothetical protein